MNMNFAAIYDEVPKQRVRPAASTRRELLEDSLGLLVPVNQCGLGQFFYRFAEPGEL
jgi:hypothetical protein